MRLYILLSSLAVWLTFTTTQLLAQGQNAQLTTKEQNVVIDSISNKLKSNYVFPEVADKMASHIQTNLRKGNYKTIKDHQVFASKLTEDLREISKDLHLRVMYDPKQIAEQQQAVTAEDSMVFLNRHIKSLKRDNFGFKELKILSGNIGYLDLRSFSNVEYGGETAVAAMNFLSNTDAIIIDLRQNGGGSPQMIQLITSYLFNSEPVHLNSFYNRPSDSHSQTWTLPHVSGKRSPDVPVYVLTSTRTFSAAEEFSYNLKHLKRATLIGETTGGGAHPGGPIIATDNYIIWTPNGRAINPITNTNWEGTGVNPHIETNESEALDVAHLKALKHLIELNDDKRLNHFYEWPLAALKSKTNPITLDVETLKSYVGTYGPRQVTFEDGKLFYQRGKGTKYELQPYSDKEFILKGLDYFRIRFLLEDGQVVALQGLYESGRTDKNARDD